jgi:alpha-1,2-mannosyltransferase
MDDRGGGSTNYDALYAKLTVAAAAMFVALEVDYVAIAKSLSWAMPSIDAYGYAIGRDFLNTWMGGRSAFAGGPAPWFDAATYNAALRELTDRADFPPHFWSYPPHLILLIWPLGRLPYMPAYLLWCVGGLALYLFAAWSGGVGRKSMLFLAVAPAVTVNVFFGHTGFVTAALLIGGLAQLDRRPLLAGVLFGLLTIKPQFGLLLPVLLVVTGRWRVIAAAIATTVALVAATALWLGTDVWSDYVRLVVPQQRWILEEAGAFGWSTVASAYVNARLIGLPEAAAWAVQGVTSAGALVMVVWAFWRRRDAVLANALFVTATFLFSPWMLTYDLVVFGWVIALLRQRGDGTAVDQGLIVGLWMLPVAMLALAPLHIPIAMMVLPAVAGRLIWRLSRGQLAEAGAQPAAAADAIPAVPVAGLAPH